MQKLPTHAPRVGDRVRLRRERWRIVDLRAFDACQLITLCGAGASNAGAERRVLSPFDLVEPIERSPRLRLVRPHRWRRQCRALLAEARPAGALQTARHARIDLLPHQLEPALAIVRGLGSRILIADEVGLGKTIQAGLIVSELQAMGAADRVLVLAPAGLREQWRAELADRFGIEAAILDMRETRRVASTLPVGLNPWSTIRVAVASIDYVKRPEVLPSILGCRWDIVIVDEAHGVAPGSDRHVAVSALSVRAAYVVLLTATPHNGDRTAFESLCRIGASITTGATTGAEPSDGLLVFRRSRQTIALGAGRRIHRVQVRSSADELRMHECLARFSRAVRAERGDDDASARLILTTLHKRALSSARSLEASVARRLSAVPAGRPDGLAQLALPLDEGAGELDVADEPPAWTWPALDDPDRERQMLARIADAARMAAGRETKLARLARLLARLHARGEPAIVFTEYRDTLLHVERMLARPCAVIHGGLAREERRAALDDFRSGRRAVLLATDAAGEGLNLHQTCRVVINLELPWNPMRLEQRIGRVDRIGQSRRVHAFNLIASETGERRLFERLEARVALARRDVGAANPLGTDMVSELSALESATPEMPAGFTALVRLSDEAAAEHARLQFARMLTGDRRDSLDVALLDPSVACARAPATRSRLTPHLLALLQWTCEDDYGRCVASYVAPLAIDGSTRIDRRRAMSTVSEIVPLLERLAPALVEAAWAAWSVWRASNEQIHGRFWRTKISRERSIALALAEGSHEAFQPGLFDHRAERSYEVTANERASLIRDANERVAAAERAAACHVTAARVALVLLP